MGETIICFSFFVKTVEKQARQIYSSYGFYMDLRNVKFGSNFIYLKN